MGIKYTEFKTTGANLLADIGAAILGSSDWAKPNAGARPNTFKTTTTRGAQIVVDLNDAAPTVTRMQIGVYQSYDGTTLGPKMAANRFLYPSAGGGTFATNAYYVTLSCSKEHFFLAVEGPKAGETGADSASYGSLRSFMFLSDLVPYFDTTLDPAATVVGYCSSATTWASAVGSLDHKVLASKSIDLTRDWPLGSLQTLEHPTDSIGTINVNRVGRDGNTYLAPFVYFDDGDGIRGRLSSIFYAGSSAPATDQLIPPVAVGSLVTYNGITYKIIMPIKGNPAVGNLRASPLGSFSDGGVNFLRAPLIAVPYA